MTFAAINEVTGFASGETFANDAEVLAYFQRAVLLDCVHGGDPDDIPDQAVLDEMARTVIANRWHYEGAPDLLRFAELRELQDGPFKKFYLIKEFGAPIRAAGTDPRTLSCKELVARIEATFGKDSA